MERDWPTMNVQFHAFLMGQFIDMPEHPSQSRLTDRICQSIRDRIASGVLASGARVPSTRALAAEWGASRTTVTAAYDQLIAEGYLEARQGAATRVASGLPQSPLPSQHPASRHRKSAEPSGNLSAYGRRLAAFAIPTEGDRKALAVDFRYGDIAGDDFPRLAWKRAVTAALLRKRPSLRYGDPSGSPRLRTALQGYLWRARAMRCEPDQIVIVNGSQQGIDLCARLLLDPADRVLMENPGYGLARQVFQAAGADVIPIPVDEDGMRTERLPPARLAYTTPSHQFPLGGVMSAARRRDLLAWAERGGGYVIEDDYDGEYRFDVSPIPALQVLDDAGRVIHLGTVSKILSPDLRLGYLVVPETMAPVFAKAKRLADRHTPGPEQEALADLIESGAYERHIRRVRRRNGERRSALLAALAETFGKDVTVVGAAAGLHVLVWLNSVPRVREEALIARAWAAGVGIYPVGPLFDPAAAAPDLATAGLVVGYASLDEEAIRRGVRLLRQVVDESQPDRPGSSCRWPPRSS
ncbi:PLP-dependent aminotransferase family protein [Azospirillum doebereinerae]|uniref:MocR-like pyridoxine biosynthesis transcription factor PdxR n=1 Tax=Azospirillum doebereinerae TaxID=92933 RepID=UPI001EE50C08|nr:PLP-dependent aminotransferase family protein [Azospirillum doebereinerae]MCG5239961.1 PLP-dependent aminotransferase family protein [Azospirillum doebereinerae]